MSAAQCSSCGASCFWVKFGSGKRSLVDSEPSDDGNISLMTVDDPPLAIVLRKDQRSPGFLLYTSHFATCPNAAQHRRPK